MRFFALVLVAVLAFPTAASALVDDAATTTTTSSSSSTPPWSWSVQQRFLMYSYASFCGADANSRAQLLNWTCFWCTQTDHGVNVTGFIEDEAASDVFGYIGTTSGSSDSGRRAIVVAFRGSITVANWESDFQFWENAFPEVPNARIHHGFYSAWMRVADSVLASVQALVKELGATQQEPVEVHTVGHSLGAALTAICALELTRQPWSSLMSVHMMNYGQPRIGDAALATFIQQKLTTQHLRIINHRDIVPHLPPLAFWYVHAPQELWYSDQNSYKTFTTCSNSTGEDFSCSDSLDEFTPKDHSLYLGYDLHQGYSHGCGNPKHETAPGNSQQAPRTGKFILGRN